ncbi:hypothetical protein BDN72DRAFT_890787 [Pluteus cervinus]|uniref:Uncharacterized protein n=1 Tax=Pluteus cervinus TaxID=181527 RepID=A0ACD3BGP7_9AGAR|nr:hypothetical protein BDN72DRAFT_890787 [Pluteus cervinus]
MPITSESTPLLSPRMAARSLWKAGALLVSFGMIAGAFGSHGLKKRDHITSDQLQAFGTAANYAIYNGLGLLALSLHPKAARYRTSGLAILAGGAIFSGSIIALVLHRDRFRFLGPVTPLGGLVMIGGYLSLVFL